MSQRSAAERLEQIERDFASYRRRMRGELAEAEKRGRDTATLALVELVDDCDRALEHLAATEADGARQQIVTGIAQLRQRALRRFAAVGLEPFCEAGEKFDPELHQAIDAERGGSYVIKVHERGWRRAEDGTVTRTAKVSVGKQSEIPRLTLAEREPTRRHRASPEPPGGPYVCPYGTPDCIGDCPDCTLMNAIEGGG
jgi:molecular chaperone GrpE (heat shock protein)